MHAMYVQLKYMIEVEGLDNRFKRHLELAHETRAWATKHFSLFAKEGYESQTVTTILNTKQLDTKMLAEKLFEKGYVFADGYGSYKGKTFRIGHMGDRTMKTLKQYLLEIERLWQ